MIIKCPECKISLDIGASDPKKALEAHYKNFHPDKATKIKQQPGQSLHNLIGSVKSQLLVNTLGDKEHVEMHRNKTDVQSGGSDEGVEGKDNERKTVPNKRKFRGATKN